MSMTTDAPSIAPAPDQYDCWRRLLAKDPSVWANVNDGNIQAGFYRDGDRAVAVWFTEAGVLKCKVDNRLIDENTARERWSFYVKRAVTHEDYEERIYDGNWPGETEAVTYLSNNPPADDSLEAILAAIEVAEKDAQRMLKRGPAVTQREADEAANIADVLSKLHSKADSARKAEKQPWKDKADAVDEKWRPVTALASIYTTVKDSILTPFLKLKREAKEKAAVRAREVVLKAQREAAEKERLANAAAEAARVSGDTRAAARASEVAEAARSNVVNAEATALAIEAAPVTAGTRGRKTAGRGVDVVTIEDRAKVLEFFLSQPATAAEIDDLLLTMAKRAVKARMTVPGINVFKDTVAA